MNEIGGMPLVARRIAAAGRDWTVHAVENEDALLALAERREPFPFGLLLWESAIALAAEIGERAPDFAGRRVLELGCGVGLPGLVAANCGARVTATDHDALALELARANAAENGIRDIAFATGDWTDWHDDVRYDVVIGADVTYDRAAHTAVLAILARNLLKDGIALLADPGREDRPAFLARAMAAGFVVGECRRLVTDLVRPGVTVAVELLELRNR